MRPFLLHCTLIAILSVAAAGFLGRASAASTTPGTDSPAPGRLTDAQILSRYFAAAKQQSEAMRGMTMEVDIDAELPKLKKQGKLHALRNISKVGKVTYHMLGFSGDNTIKKDVIARYLTAEVQAQGSQSNLGINSENYKFKFKGLESADGRSVYVFHLTPRHKRVGLFKGELWLDPDTFMPVRESGRFVKSPSVFFKKMVFVREYTMADGVAVPRHIESRVETRIIGPVELSINFTNPAKTMDAEESAASGDE
jgi:hypothetical protein